MDKEQRKRMNEKFAKAGSQALHIGIVSESISITKNELQSFLEDWDDGKQNVCDVEWNGLSKRLANFMGLLIP